ncbi:MAG: uncharacterized protein JWP04_1903 [Belnapia sp.]|nr:uncharacterized protein [Belnapia sp.]
MTVLLVEDDCVVRLTIGEYFESIGLDVLEAAAAPEALDILRNPARQIDVLVTDLDLGAGDDGLALAAMARREKPGLRVVYATGSPERFIGYRLADWEQVFLKPFDTSLLGTAVSAMVEAEARKRGRRNRIQAACAMGSASSL